MKDLKIPELPVALLGMRLLNMLKLNILFVLCCLPIITIGPALSALYYVVNLYAEEKSDEVAKPFFRAFRRDFWQGLLLGLFVLFLTGLAFYNGLFLFANYAGRIHPIWIPFLVLLLFLAAMYVYSFPMLSRYQLHFMEILKNSLILFWRNLWASLGVLLVHSIPFLLVYLYPGAAAEIIFLWILIGCSLTASVSIKIIMKIFNKEQEKSDSGHTPA